MNELKHRLTTMILGMLGLALLSCEDQIYPTLEKADPILVVDGWLNNRPQVQVIILTKSQPYFENTVPPAVSNATVTVSDDKGKTYVFLEDDKRPGYYLWKPQANEVFGTVGNAYKLSIQAGGESFESTSYMGRVPAIDSIVFDTEKRIGSNDSITRGEFWAVDPRGPGDAYWIRTYKNGILLNKPDEINIAYDAGFSPGGQTDGVAFITPIRRGINPNDTDANDNLLSPYEEGDSVNVQLLSITKQAFNYLNQVAIQTNRPGGFSELFATPLANVSTNITNTNPKGSKALGFFNVSAVSIAGKRYKK